MDPRSAAGTRKESRTVRPCLFLAIEGLTPQALARLPALESLAAAGLAAELTFQLADARVATLVSAMTGTWPDKHGILMAQTGDPAKKTLRPAAVADRGQAAVWERLDASGVECISVGWPLAITAETERSAIVAAGFGKTLGPDLKVDLTSFIHPTELTDSLAECWLRPDELDGEMLAPLVPQWQQVDQAVDNRLGVLAAALAENISRHAAFIELLDQQAWQFATLCLSLPADLASLERASDAFADGLFDGLGERGLDLINAFLSAIVQRLPEETSMVIAGLPHAQTPTVSGLLIASGPAFDPASVLARVDVPDLVPMIWSACGFASTLTTRPCDPLQTGKKLLHVDGDIFRSRDTPLLPGEVWQNHSLMVMARSLMARGNALQALPFWFALSRLLPYDPKPYLQLAQCQRQLGLMEEALDAAYAAVDAQFNKNPTPLLLAAELEALSGRPEISRQVLARALPYLAEVEQLQVPHANVLILQREWKAASQLLEIVVRETPQDAHAQLLLARCHLAVSQWQAAFDHAILSINLDSSQARIHEILGHALLGLGMRAQAWQAFEQATVVDPRWPRPWAKIAMLARLMNKPAEDVERHTAAYQRVKEEQRKHGQALAEAARAHL